MPEKDTTPNFPNIPNQIISVNIDNTYFVIFLLRLYTYLLKSSAKFKKL